MTSVAIGRINALRGDGLTRFALNIDAAVSGLNGIAYLAAADVLDGPLGVPATFLRGVGAFFVVWAVALAYTAAQRDIKRTAVYTVIALNVVWVVASLAFAALDWYDPTTGGAVWTILQAGVVAGFAALQGYALRRTRGAM